MNSLQIPGLPGGFGLAAILLVILVVLLVVVVLVGRWVYRDAKEQGSEHPMAWGVGVGVLFFGGLVPGLLGVILYVLLVRH